MARFYKLTAEVARTVRKTELTAAEFRLWLYFIELDPFGDQYVELPPLIEILTECDISERTFYRAIAKFKKNLFDFQYDKAYIRNLQCKCSTVKNGSETVKNGSDDDKNGSEFAKSGSTSIYTELQTDQTLSEAREKIEQSFNAEPTEPLTPITEIKFNSPVNPVISFEDKFSAERTNKRTRGFNWLPDGPWVIDGKLDPNFRDFVANDWLKRFGGDIHQKRADVLQHFKKDPDNLAIAWEQYQGEYLDRVRNTQILLNNGQEIPKEYQDRLIANQRAITAELPPALNPIALPEVKPAAIAPALPQSIDHVVNEDGHKLKVFRASDLEVTPEEAAKNREWLSSQIKGMFGGKKAEIKPQLSELEQLNQWIHDPVLRPEALKRVMKSDRHKCLFDEEGNPCEVIECEEF